jgi:hypothetical protein
MERLTQYAEQLGDLRLGPRLRRQKLVARKFAGVHGRQAALRFDSSFGYDLTTL